MPKKVFASGDLVFAKVKGYPPWPARVIATYAGGKLKVFFYGTFETASLKNADLCHYTEASKAENVKKYSHRKGYKEGIEQIEKTPEIAPNSDAELPKPDKAPPASPSERGVKRRSLRPKVEEEEEEKTSRSGRLIKKKKFDDDTVESPHRAPEAKSSGNKKVGPSGASSALKETSEPRKIWVKVKSTGDLIEINLDKKRPAVWESTEQRIQWEMATARNAIKFKRQLENGEHIPPEIMKKLEEKAILSAEEVDFIKKERKLEKRKNKLKWLKVEQKLVTLDSGIKSALTLHRPNTDQCIKLLDELLELEIAPLMLKKQSGIVHTVRRLRKYSGPDTANIDKSKENRQKLKKNVEIICGKAEQLYTSIKAVFGYEGNSFWDHFENLVKDFKRRTAGMEETAVLALVKEPPAAAAASQ